jgi:maltooligosyltrehalose trehalohydrolase
MTALLLLGPNTPMLFQGQEFNASSPFMFFADFESELAAAVRSGRGEFLMQFPSIAPLVRSGVLDDPGADATFERCRLDFAERDTHSGTYALHIDLLRMRREEAAFRAQGRHGLDGSVLSASAFALRFFTPDHREDRILIVNLGADLNRTSFAEPLLAPPAGSHWLVRWSSEDPAYGGGGTPEIQPDNQWFVPAESAVVLAPGPLRRVRPNLIKAARGV